MKVFLYILVIVSLEWLSPVVANSQISGGIDSVQAFQNVRRGDSVQYSVFTSHTAGDYYTWEIVGGKPLHVPCSGSGKRNDPYIITDSIDLHTISVKWDTTAFLSSACDTGRVRVQKIASSGCISFTRSIPVKRWSPASISIQDKDYEICSGTATTGNITLQLTGSGNFSYKYIVKALDGTTLPEQSVTGITGTGATLALPASLVNTSTTEDQTYEITITQMNDAFMGDGFVMDKNFKITVHPSVNSVKTIVSRGATKDYTDVVCSGDIRVYTISDTTGASKYKWTVDGYSSVRDYGDSVEVVWGTVDGVYNLSVEEKSVYGCTSNSIIGIVKVSVPKIDLGTNLKICKGNNLKLDAGNGFANYKWNNGEITSSILVEDAGTYSVVATDAYGCKVSSGVNVIITPRPYVHLGNDTTILVGEKLYMDAGPANDTLSYLWFDNTTAHDNYLSASSKVAWVLVTNSFGCFSSDSILINPDFRVSNTITPNGDGKNDTWDLPFLNDFPNAKVQVYDRWGQIVFQSNHGTPAGGWDGTYNGRPLPMDSYYYIIDFNNSDFKPISGTLTIVR